MNYEKLKNASKSGVSELIPLANGKNLNLYNIICNLKGRTKSAYGYVWKYKHGNTVPSQDN